MTDTITLSSIRSQATPGGRRNIVINGAMQVQQRYANTNDPTGILTSATYPLMDRYQVLISNTSFTATANTNSGAQQHGFRKHLRFDVNAANTATSGSGDYFIFSTSFEGQDLQQIKKGTSKASPLSLQFWVRSNVTGNFTLTANDIDNIRESSTIYTINNADTWEHKQITIPADTTGSLDNDNNESLRLMWWLSATSGGAFSSGTHVNNTWTTRSNPNRLPTSQVQLNTSASNYFEITGVQLEVGSVATPFEHRSYGEELELCMRYYIQSSNDGDTSQFDGAQPLFGWGSATHNAAVSYASGFRFPNKMRGVPQVTLYHQDGTSGAVYRVYDANKTTGVSAANISNQGVLQLFKSAGLNQGIGYYCSYTADAEL